MASLLFLLALALAPGLAASLCECGFSMPNPLNDTEHPWVFTDMIESDFTKIHNISQDTQWVQEEYNVSAAAGRGTYGKQFLPSNVIEQSTATGGDDTTQAQDQGGLVLRVDGALDDGAVRSAEIDTRRLDLHWGSYRAGLKLPEVAGTCAAFFWYFNDTQEIDIEFLTMEFDRDKHIFPVNLVIQSKQSLQAGYDASKTGTYQRVNLTFDPTTAFHEYRFDFAPGRVLFYADSTVLAEMQGDAIPTQPGHVILQHWSNGNPLWSGGPPATDAYLTVSYVKAYFNGSDTDRQSGYTKHCGKASGDVALCVIPDVTAVNASTGGQFFSDQSSSGTAGKDQSHTGSSADKGEDSGSSRLGGGSLAAALLTMGVMMMELGRIR